MTVLLGCVLAASLFPIALEIEESLRDLYRLNRRR